MQYSIWCYNAAHCIPIINFINWIFKNIKNTWFKIFSIVTKLHKILTVIELILNIHQLNWFYCFLPLCFPINKRVNSAVELRKEETIAPLEDKNDMDSSIKEVLFQKAKELERRQKIEQNETEETTPMKENIDNILDTMEDSHSMRNLSLSLIEASRKAGISYIVYPKKRKMKWKKALKFSKLATVLSELSKPPKVLSRSCLISNCYI